jgi:hypothetical protein
MRRACTSVARRRTRRRGQGALRLDLCPDRVDLSRLRNKTVEFPRFGGQGLIRSWLRWLVQ